MPFWSSDGWTESGVRTETIARFADLLAERFPDEDAAAEAWTEAGFEDDDAARWLEARCFDADAARGLADLGVTPRQASQRTRAGKRDYRDTIAFKVSSGDLSVRQGAARASSSR